MSAFFLRLSHSKMKTRKWARQKEGWRCCTFLRLCEVWEWDHVLLQNSFCSHSKKATRNREEGSRGWESVRIRGTQNDVLLQNSSWTPVQKKRETDKYMSLSVFHFKSTECLLKSACQEFNSMLSRYSERSQRSFRNSVLTDWKAVFLPGQICSHSFESVSYDATKSVVRYIIMEEMAGRSRLRWERGNSGHIIRVSIAHLFVFELEENRFKLGEMYSKRLLSYSQKHDRGVCRKSRGQGCIA